MDYENIILQVKRSLLDTLEHVHEADITEDTKIRDELGLDSMSSLTFIMALEENIPNFIVDAETLQAEDLYSVKVLQNMLYHNLILIKYCDNEKLKEYSKS